MPLKSVAKAIITETLEGLPALAMHHLTVLWSGKIALIAADDKTQGADGQDGAGQAAHAVLTQLTEDPVELVRLQTADGRVMDGVRLKSVLFEPLAVLELTPTQSLCYQAALNTAETQMRGLFDSLKLYPNEYVGEVS